MNILLYAGIIMLSSGFILYIVSMLMISHYDRKLFLLNQKMDPFFEFDFNGKKYKTKVAKDSG